MNDYYAQWHEWISQIKCGVKYTKESRQHNYILYVFVHIKVTNMHKQFMISEVMGDGTLVGSNVTFCLLHLEAKGVHVDYVKTIFYELEW